MPAEEIYFEFQPEHIFARTFWERNDDITAFLKSGDLRLHPLITRLVDKETLEKMGAKRA